VIVLDASAAVALLVDSGPLGAQVGSTVLQHEVAYPSLLPYEVVSALRRLAATETISAQLASSALRDAALLDGQQFECVELSSRVWELRHNISTYDASYVALAELLQVPLLTLDSRLRTAPGVRCEFVDLATPDA